VIVSSDGLTARKFVGDDLSPVRQIIIAIVDETTEEQAA
jgi:microcompartment protein CcmK/EutM